MVQLFGFEISRKKQQDQEEKNKSFALPQNDDGAVTIQSGAYYGTYVDLDGVGDNGDASILSINAFKYLMPFMDPVETDSMSIALFWPNFMTAPLPKARSI